MREIKLSNSSKVALIDDEDFDKLGGYSWRSLRIKESFYAVSGYFACMVYMHRLVLPDKVGFEIDHKDRDSLNNQKENLRYATFAQNQANKGLRFDNMSGAKGVCWHPGAGKWMARLNINKRAIYLGVFSDKASAIAAYNKAAKEHLGEFAYVNV